MTFPIKLTIPSHSRYLCLARAVLRQYLACANVPEETVGKLVLCVDEACANIIKHSYGGNCECPIDMTYECDGRQFTIQIQDYGKQCDPEAIKPRPLSEIRPGGLGTHFIFEIMDHVDYCTKREKGTLLTMSKKLVPAGQADA